MRSITFLLFLAFLSARSFSQKMLLTPDNFVSKEDDTKNYIIIDIPEKTQIELFEATKSFIASIYNNPKFVSSEIEGKQIVVDGISAEVIKGTFDLYSSKFWNLSHKYTFDFKDNKVRFEPYFKNLINETSNSTVSLNGMSFMGSKSGIYNKKGKELTKNSTSQINEVVNAFIEAYQSFLRNPDSKINTDW